LNHFFEAFYKMDNGHYWIRTKSARVTFNDCSILKWTSPRSPQM